MASASRCIQGKALELEKSDCGLCRPPASHLACRTIPRIAMKIIVQCAGRKDRMAGSFLFSGKKVKFVSRPEIAALEEATDFSYFRPDDVGDIGSGLVGLLPKSKFLVQ